jgi:hypothetical protein
MTNQTRIMPQSTKRDADQQSRRSKTYIKPALEHLGTVAELTEASSSVVTTLDSGGTNPNFYS